MNSDSIPRVLIVDDRPENLMALRAILEGPGRLIDEACGGEECLAAASRRDYAVILLDVQMPEMDGYEVARRLRTATSAASTPIIFVTALDRRASHEQEGYGAGAVDYLFKPLNPVVTAAKVDVFIRLWEQRAELERSNRDLQQFASAIAHDLRTPLQTIIGFSDVLELALGSTLPSKHVASLHAVRDGALRLADMVEGLLSWSRVGTETRALEPVQTSEVAEEVLRDLGSLVEQTGARVVVGALPRVLGDRAQLGQLFQNLIANGIKFRSDKPAELMIRASGGVAFIEFQVTDNGIGIPPDQHNRVFEMFARAHDHRTFEGHGVGLAISRRIVERHGGDIWIESAEGHGTTVHFTLKPAALPLRRHAA